MLFLSIEHFEEQYTYMYVSPTFTSANVTYSKDKLHVSYGVLECVSCTCMQVYIYVAPPASCQISFLDYG